MKTSLLPLLALLSAADAAPRISQISPSTGRIDGNPVAWDLDGDGDLDLAFLSNQQVGFRTAEASTWLQNLGDREFSAPKSLGYRFHSTFRKTEGEGLIRPADSNQTFIFNHTVTAADRYRELFSKSINSTSWQAVHRFEPKTKIAFLESPVEDLPVVFSWIEFQQQIALWVTRDGRSLAPVGMIELPEPPGSQEANPKDFQAADLDQDGDSDLILNYEDRTLVYERIGATVFSGAPLSFDLSDAVIGDFNLDGKPDLMSREDRSRVILNEGGFTFKAVRIEGVTNYSRSFSLGVLGGKPTMFNLERSGQTQKITIQKSSGDLRFDDEITIEEDLVNIDSLIVADFDQDGNSDVIFVSNFRPAPRPIWNTSQSGNTLTNLELRPKYDKLLILWGQSDSLSSSEPAYREAPIMCDKPAVGDFNNDGFKDLIVGPDINGQARILLNDSHGRFPESRLLTELLSPEWEEGSFDFHSYVPVDFNQDGKLDLSITVSRLLGTLVNTEARHACAIAMGDGQGGFSPLALPVGAFETVADGFCQIVDFKDWDGDGDLDAILPGAWRENMGGELREGAYPLIANAATSDALGNPVSLASQQISDIDGDGFYDILIPAFTRSLIQVPGRFYEFKPGIAFNSGNGGIEDVTDFESNLPASDALGNPYIFPYLALDLDLDGRSEILTAETTTDALGNPVYLRLIRYQFDADSPRDIALAEALPFPIFSVPLTDELQDFNGDGELEYVAADQYITPTVRGPVISPKYSFRGDHVQRDFPDRRAIAVADFDNDGDVDSLYGEEFSGLHLVRNSIVDEDSPITSALIAKGLTPAKSSPEVDPDHDGRSNALEYLHGTNPEMHDQAPANFLQVRLSPNGRRLHFSQRANAADFALFYDLEVSEDLIHWSRAADQMTLVESTDGIWSEVSKELPQAASARFYRISATHDPRRQ